MKTWKPLKVLFIGDKPSSKNVDEDIPFVGTPSYKRLLKWIGELDLDIHHVRLENKVGDILILEKEHFDAIVFLGKASELLVQTGKPEIELPRLFTVDHPSPRNRNLNDPMYEKKMLKQLKEWLYE